MRGLYAIVDVSTLARHGVHPVPFAEAVLSAAPAALQVRAKDLAARPFLELLRELAPRCRRAGVPLVANDRADLAALGGCDMVHVGQDDLPVALVRRIAPRVAVGVSTHDASQLAEALASAPDYVAYGPVFTTHSKDNASPVVGLAGLAAAASMAAAVGVPLVAIGGIDVARARLVAEHAQAGAVISALFGEDPRDLDGVARSARALQAALRPRARDAALSAPS